MAVPVRFKGTFKRGSKGRDCAAVKRCLKRIQKNPDIKLRTLEFGPAATKALKRFQTNHDLRADGIYGENTHNKLSPLFNSYERQIYAKQPFRTNVIENWAVKAPGADRAGTSLKAYVQAFVAKAAKVYGHPVVITTGTNHNKYVLGTNHVSDHWSGDAADVAMLGDNLTRFGQAALEAAGMSHAQAVRCRGGVYNVGRWNILFNTNVGGNHWNHCHMGGGH